MNYDNTTIHSFSEADIANLSVPMGTDISRSLMTYPSDIEEVIHDTFADMSAGLSPLPPPMTMQALFHWMRKRVKWNYSHIREANARFAFKGATPKEIEVLIKEVKNDPTLSPRQRNLSLRNLQRQLELLVAVPDRDHGIHIHRLDRKIVRKEIKRIVHTIFKEHRVSTKCEGAFIDAFFSDRSAKERAKDWDMSEDHVNVSKHTLTRLLNACRAAFCESKILRDYYPWLRRSAA
ncbi:MAG: hypothetical protein Q4G65_17185 [bacterium]|nr:hypothetical protein [bacterium]